MFSLNIGSNIFLSMKSWLQISYTLTLSACSVGSKSFLSDCSKAVLVASISSIKNPLTTKKSFFIKEAVDLYSLDLVNIYHYSLENLLYLLKFR